MSGLCGGEGEAMARRRLWGGHQRPIGPSPGHAARSSPAGAGRPRALCRAAAPEHPRLPCAQRTGLALLGSPSPGPLRAGGAVELSHVLGAFDSSSWSA